MFGRERKQAIASRVFVTDAKCLQTTDVFEETITPPILASPKPTAFQHYLTQSNEYNLKHYASKTHEETVIRGHKLYWHRGKNAFDDLKAKDNPSEQSTQHTRFKPVKPGVSFEFKIYFENLSNEELGVLCWVLHPNGESGETYYHKLGMGKAFGMGAVELTADLHLTERSWAEDSAETKRNSRYGQLFDDENNWQTGENSDDQSKWQSFVDSFEKKILAELTEMSKNRLAEVDRIKMLLKMLEWEENFDDRIKRTLRLEEFKDRNVLPDPLDAGETITEGKTGQTEANPDSNKKIGTVRVLGSLPKTKQ